MALKMGDFHAYLKWKTPPSPPPLQTVIVTMDMEYDQLLCFCIEKQNIAEWHSAPEQKHFFLKPPILSREVTAMFQLIYKCNCQNLYSI